MTDYTENVSDKMIHDILRELPLFKDLYLNMQVLNISMVDGYLNGLESDLLREYMMSDRTPIPQSMFVSALSQMWIFAFYELLRTWRQQVRELLESSEKLNELTGDEKEEYIAEHSKLVKGKSSGLGVEIGYYINNFKEIEQNPDFQQRLKTAQDLITPLFRRIESLRVTLAKHEVPKTNGVRATAPGYGRIDTMDGSLYWLIDLKDGYSDVISRRSLADQCKHLLDTD